MVKKRILFLSKGAHSASTRYRALNYFPYLSKNGWLPSYRSVHGTVAEKIKMLLEARDAEVVVVLRKTFELPMLVLLRLASRKLVFDFDDTIFVETDGSSSRGRLRRFKSMLKFCDQAWSGNQYLAEHARKFNANVIIIPTAIDFDRYTLNEPKPRDFIDLVWIGSNSTSRYLKELLPVLEQAARRIKNLRLKVIADFELDSDRLPVKNVPWSHDTEIQELASAHIGIAPMTDNSWTRGKCGLKILQYMACRLPVISSSTGVNKEIIVQGVSGLLVNNSQQWVSAISRLAESESDRKTMGEAGAEICRRSYSRKICAKIMLERLDNL